MSDKNLEDDERIQKLIKRYQHPTLEDILPLTKEYGVQTPMDLWNFFDKIKKMWMEAKSYEAD